MRFRLCSVQYSCDYCSENDIRWALQNRIDFLEEYPCLNEFNITITEEQESLLHNWWTFPIYIELDSLEQLVELQHKVEHELIIENDVITIYDGYIE
jgi:hypothetical protein